MQLGVLCTEVGNALSSPGDTRVSREPLMVNCICGSLT